MNPFNSAYQGIEVDSLQNTVCTRIGVPILAKNSFFRDELVSNIISELVAVKCVAIAEQSIKASIGSGKSTLATAVCYHPITESHFDIIVWAELKSLSTAKSLYSILVHLLHLLLPAFSVSYSSMFLELSAEINEMTMFLRYLLSFKKVLFVFDEVEDQDMLGCLASLGSRVLLTTSNHAIAEQFDGCKLTIIGPMADKDAEQLINRTITTTDLSGNATRDIIRLAGGSPLLVCLLTYFKAFFPQLNEARNTLMHALPITFEWMWDQLAQSTIFRMFVKIVLLSPLCSAIPFDIAYALLQHFCSRSNQTEANFVIDALQVCGLWKLAENQLVGTVDLLVAKRVEVSIRNWFWERFGECDSSIGIGIGIGIRHWLSSDDLVVMIEAVVDYSTNKTLMSSQEIINIWQHMNVLSNSIKSADVVMPPQTVNFLERYDSAISRAENAVLVVSKKKNLSSNLFPRSSILLSATQRPLGGVVADADYDYIQLAGELQVFVQRLIVCVVIVRSLVIEYLRERESSSVNQKFNVLWKQLIPSNVDIDTVYCWCDAWIHRASILASKLLNEGKISSLVQMSLAYELSREVHATELLPRALDCLSYLREEIAHALLDAGTSDGKLLTQFIVVSCSIAAAHEQEGNHLLGYDVLRDCHQLCSETAKTENSEAFLVHIEKSVSVYSYFLLRLPLQLSSLLHASGKLKESRGLLEQYIALLDGTFSSATTLIGLRWFLHRFLVALGALLRDNKQPKRGLKLLDKALHQCISGDKLALGRNHPACVSDLFEICKCISLIESDSSTDSQTGEMHAEALVSSGYSMLSEVLQWSCFEHPLDSIGLLARVVFAFNYYKQFGRVSDGIVVLSQYLGALSAHIDHTAQSRSTRRYLLFARSVHDELASIESWTVIAGFGDDWNDFIQSRTLKLFASFVSRLLFEAYLQQGDIQSAKAVIFNNLRKNCADCMEEQNTKKSFLENGIFLPYLEIAEVYKCMCKMDTNDSVTYLAEACLALSSLVESYHDNDGLISQFEFQYVCDLTELATQLGLCTSSENRHLAEHGLTSLLIQVEILLFKLKSEEHRCPENTVVTDLLRCLLVDLLLLKSESHNDCGDTISAYNSKIAGLCVLVDCMQIASVKRYSSDDCIVSRGLFEDDSDPTNLITSIETLVAADTSQRDNPSDDQLLLERSFLSHDNNSFSELQWLNRESMLQTIEELAAGMVDSLGEIEDRRYHDLLCRVEQYVLDD